MRSISVIGAVAASLVAISSVSAGAVTLAHRTPSHGQAATGAPAQDGKSAIVKAGFSGFFIHQQGGDGNFIHQQG